MEQHRIPSGIRGLDSILGGGYPVACPTLLKGGPGVGKTLFSLAFANNQLLAGEAVVIVTCDESPDRLNTYMDVFERTNTNNFDQNKLTILDFRPTFSETVEGEFHLSPILARISNAVEETKARVLIIDSLQNMLMNLGVQALGKALLELFLWVREQGITTLITVGVGPEDKRDNVLEEYAVDCVIHLSQNIEDHLMTRYLRVVKMRGAAHGTNEFPFSVTQNGISILPITATRLKDTDYTARVSTGVEGIDIMLGGKGYQRSSAVMLSGRSGSGKTIFAATMAKAVLERGQKVVFISFEESREALVLNLGSVGLNLSESIEVGNLLIHGTRAVEMGLEDHLISIIDLIDRESPELLILDPISALSDLGTSRQVKMLLVRFVSHVKDMGISFMFTELLPDASEDYSSLAISSLADTWIRVRQVEDNGELNRLVNVVKSRGTKTSNQVKEFTITGQGIVIEEPYIGEGGMVVGAAKAARITAEVEKEKHKAIELEHAEQALAALQDTHNAKLKAGETDFILTKRELTRKIEELKRQSKNVSSQRDNMRVLRQ